MIGCMFCGMFWWIFPLVMIVLFVFFMRKGGGRMRWRLCDWNRHGESATRCCNTWFANADNGKWDKQDEKAK